MLKVAGVVILYNPKNDFITNILSYLNQVELVYVVDNSESASPNNKLLDSYSTVRRINNNGNIGIAAALNKSASMASKDGFDLLLTMDQDSRISDSFVKGMLKEFERDDNIGVISPFIVHTKNPQQPIISGIENVTTAITSGSIIRLTAHRKISGFLEKLFIDYVDHEYCLRMRSNGYKILRLNSVRIYHELGDVKSKKFLFMNVFPTNHFPLRWYYRTRNRFYVYNTYKNQFPDYIKFDKRMFLKEIFKILLYEEYKIQKIKMIIYGYLDFKRNKFGKLINRSFNRDSETLTYIL